MKVVDFSNSGLEYYPFLPEEANNIEYIDLSGNSFSEIPSELFLLKKIKLILIRNQNKKLDEDSLARYKKQHPTCRIIK
ncbi:MAG: hypothetical protein PVH88_27950 [Ignavibacteria bacterium]